MTKCLKEFIFGILEITEQRRQDLSINKLHLTLYVVLILQNTRTTRNLGYRSDKYLYVDASGPRFTTNLKSDRNRKHISGAKMRFTKTHNLMITSVFELN